MLLQDLDALAKQLNELGAEIRPPARTVIVEDDEDKSDDDDEDEGVQEVINRDGTLLASEPARPL